jgi:hypothetical protein
MTGVRRGWVVAISLVALAACGSDEAADQPAATTPAQSSVFSPPAPTTSAPPARPRVLLIGDSTLLAIDHYDAYRALQGFDYVFDAKSCRTLGIPSCGNRPLPPNAVEAINNSDGTFDDVVIMAGYDEWWNSFPRSFDKVVAAARAKGARTIVWLTYREGVPYKLLTGERADEAFIKNNETLRDKVASGQFPDVVLAQWYPHVPSRIGWMTEDGIHLTVKGALGVADYISRWVAHVEGLPCPQPVIPGGTIEPVCSNPDPQPPIVELMALYPR